jgi:hypothetical protein
LVKQAAVKVVPPSWEMNTLSNLMATYTSLGFWGSNLTSVAGQGVVLGLGERPHPNLAAVYCVHEWPPSVDFHRPFFVWSLATNPALARLPLTPEPVAANKMGGFCDVSIASRAKAVRSNVPGDSGVQVAPRSVDWKRPWP